MEEETGGSGEQTSDSSDSNETDSGNTDPDDQSDKDDEKDEIDFNIFEEDTELGSLLNGFFSELSGLAEDAFEDLFDSASRQNLYTMAATVALVAVAF